MWALCCPKFVSFTSAVLLQRFMPIISLQFFEGPNPVLVSHKSDCAGCTEEHCFGVPQKLASPKMLIPSHKLAFGCCYHLKPYLTCASPNH